MVSSNDLACVRKGIVQISKFDVSGSSFVEKSQRCFSIFLDSLATSRPIKYRIQVNLPLYLVKALEGCFVVSRSEMVCTSI